MSDHETSVPVSELRELIEWMETQEACNDFDDMHTQGFVMGFKYSRR